MNTLPRWGLVATIKAPAPEILRFVAYHLDLGAHRIFICLDHNNPKAITALKPHPKVRVLHANAAFLKARIGYYPKKHQVRQTHNASFVYEKLKDELDWLGHIDVDEFLCPARSVAESLAACPKTNMAARVSPAESLCVEDTGTLDPNLTYCKALPTAHQHPREIERALYPTYGGAFKHGFISHTGGKVFVRTGLKDVKFAIHRAFENGETELSDFTLPDLELCHRHVQSWEKWLKIMSFRLEKGSYRAELDRNLSISSGRISRHTLFTTLQSGGSQELRAFFEETCLARPELLERLEHFGLLRRFKLNLEAKMRQHFPGFQP